MMEAIGHQNFGKFFWTTQRALKPGGKLMVQVITIPHERYVKVQGPLYRAECGGGRLRAWTSGSPSEHPLSPHPPPSQTLSKSRAPAPNVPAIPLRPFFFRAFFLPQLSRHLASVNRFSSSSTDRSGDSHWSGLRSLKCISGGEIFCWQKGCPLPKTPQNCRHPRCSLPVSRVVATGCTISQKLGRGGGAGGGPREETATPRATCPRKHSEAGGRQPECGGEWAAKTEKRPPRQPSQPQHANCRAPPTRKPHQQRPDAACEGKNG